MPELDFWVGKRIAFGTPSFIRFKADLKATTQPLSSWIVPRSELETKFESENSLTSGSNDEAARTIKTVFGEKSFNYAKPTSLIRGLLEQAASAGDLVLDFFAGSATTAQAVTRRRITPSTGLHALESLKSGTTL